MCSSFCPVSVSAFALLRSEGYYSRHPDPFERVSSPGEGQAGGNGHVPIAYTASLDLESSSKPRRHTFGSIWLACGWQLASVAWGTVRAA